MGGCGRKLDGGFWWVLVKEVEPLLLRTFSRLLSRRAFSSTGTSCVDGHLTLRRVIIVDPTVRLSN